MSLFAYNKNMKRLVLILSFAVLALVSYGQEAVQPEPAQSCILRRGDRYTVDGVTYYNSTAFRGYLKNNNTDLFAQYNKGYKLGMAGWGLFVYGTVMMPISAFMFIITRAHPDEPVTNQSTTYETYDGGIDPAFGIWISSFALASAAFCASIPMLGVGYHKMHKSVDAYNVSLQPAPQTYWSIQVSGNGIGVAYNF